MAVAIEYSDRAIVGRLIDFRGGRLTTATPSGTLRVEHVIKGEGDEKGIDVNLPLAWSTRPRLAEARPRLVLLAITSIPVAAMVIRVRRRYRNEPSRTMREIALFGLVLLIVPGSLWPGLGPPQWSCGKRSSAADARDKSMLWILPRSEDKNVYAAWAFYRLPDGKFLRRQIKRASPATQRATRR